MNFEKIFQGDSIRLFSYNYSTHWTEHQNSILCVQQTKFEGLVWSNRYGCQLDKHNFWVLAKRNFTKLAFLFFFSLLILTWPNEGFILLFWIYCQGKPFWWKRKFSPEIPSQVFPQREIHLTPGLSCSLLKNPIFTSLPKVWPWNI